MFEPSESYAFDLTHFAADAKQLDEAAFATRHGRGFLVLSRESAGLQVPEGPRKTVALEARNAGEHWKPVRFHVWPIQKSDRSLIARFVSVGRTRRNDVVIPDVSLSKFHAYVVEEEGELRLQDARSKNGTFIDGARVAPQGDGGPTVLRSGAKVRFGAVELTYLDAAGLRRLAREMAG
ncbi:MAG: FHA domain-containing protein [Myxococcales bacterium]|nr:FHA domain-containing protein [Myxococcales bacterium]